MVCRLQRHDILPRHIDVVFSIAYGDWFLRRSSPRCVSLGDVNTLVWPHRDDLVRVSVGCENVEDIIADFEQALEAVSGLPSASPAGAISALSEEIGNVGNRRK